MTTSTAASAFPHLLSPITIGSVAIRNRILSSGHDTVMAVGGLVTDQLIAYQEARARGGVGLIVIQVAGVHPTARYTSTELTADTDATIPGFTALAEAIHRHGAKVFGQLFHGGREIMDTEDGTLAVAWAPSAVPTERFHVIPRAMTETLIEEILEGFGASALRLQTAGLDGVEVVASHGYLPSQFLNPRTNLRTDGWGGDHVGRTRFAVEVVRAVRAAIGEDMPISFRFSQWKPQDFDARLAESPQELDEILGPIADAGVDIFEASARDFSEPAFADSPENLAYWTRKVTGRPTVMVGGAGVRRDKYQATMVPPQTVDNFDEIMRRHAHGEFDLLAVGRALVNDPQWLQRARTGAPFLPFNPRCLNPAYLG